METTVMDRFRRALAQRRDNLRAWLARAVPVVAGPAEDGPPDGAEGRTVLPEIDHALAHIDGGDFGRCTLCNGYVEPERLELDFTTCVCLDHYSETQIRNLERDLELAAQVQRQLFPSYVPALPGIEIAAHARPAHIVGGDYYDFFGYGDGVQGVAIADVMGKGLPASMLMANLQASLRILGPEHPRMHALATRLNALFRFNLKLIRFISMVLIAIDAEARTLQYCNAGHNPPLFRQAASGAVHRLRPTGPAIGLIPEPTFTSETLPLDAGDVLLLYTDGLVEARNAAGHQFGEERLARYVDHHHRESADDLLRGVLRAVEHFTGSPTIDDDVALLVIKVR